MTRVGDHHQADAAPEDDDRHAEGAAGEAAVPGEAALGEDQVAPVDRHPAFAVVPGGFEDSEEPRPQNAADGAAQDQAQRYRGQGFLARQFTDPLNDDDADHDRDNGKQPALPATAVSEETEGGAGVAYEPQLQ